MEAKHLSILKHTEVCGDNMSSTTIKIHEETKHQLDQLREYKNESYDEVIKKVVHIAKTCKTKPELCKEALEAIEKARKRIREGKFLSEDEARKRLGL
jgi:predicted transcriptional regulator